LTAKVPEYCPSTLIGFLDANEQIDIGFNDSQPKN